MSGIIYKITCNETGNCYVGSTTQGLNTRISNHKTHYKFYELNQIGSIHASFPIMKINNFKSVVLEIVDYDKDKKLLLLKEREWMEKLNPINTKRPIVSKEDKREYDKDYRKTEIGKLKKKEADKKYREGDKREELLEKKREWSKQNREKTKEVRSSIHECSCGKTYTLHHKARHEKTQHHIKSLNN